LKKRTINNFQQTRNKVKGRVLWQQTILLRNSKNYGDNSLYICNNPKIDFNIQENLVLKKLLHVIYSTFKIDLHEFEKDNYGYKWFNKWKSEKKLINKFFKFYQNNVYINKIKDIQNVKIHHRDILKVIYSRNNLYRKAARLLLEFTKLNNLDFEEDYLSNLLSSTLIAPEDTSTLFELYCIFKIVFKIQEDLNMKLNIISKENKEFAIFENNSYIINVFHDSTGSLNFYDNLNDIDLKNIQKYSFLSRLVNSTLSYGSIFNELTGSTSRNSLYRGRPDIVIEFWRKLSGEDKVLEKIYIGEVKYTNKKSTFSKGLKELVEYIHFAKYQKDYLLNNKERSDYISGDLEIYGILIADTTDYLKKSIGSSNDIKIDVYNTKNINTLKIIKIS
ncbi:MAG: hypothetical protein KAX18_13700, partial [Candidatus Lokiarchaeota archaeon]|nr:hypothetical protein [Candidatus Lokiarchaeota archaeon]